MNGQDLINLPTVRKAALYEKAKSDKVRCLTCERRCLLRSGEKGFCKCRANIDGKLYTLTYGDINAMSINPICKKPLFHYWPGSFALTFSTWSCNFTCKWCQNWSLSKFSPDPRKANYIPPEQMINYAKISNCQGLSVSFTEPLMLFEYTLDLFPIAKREKLYAHYISNGYMTERALEMLAEAGMDAIKFDVKGDKNVVKIYCAADVDIVWRNIQKAKQLNLHVEVVNLVIPNVNDSEECLEYIISQHLKYASEETPLHFTRFYPAYELTETPPTPVETLEKAYNMARRMGVKYPYIGNVPGHPYENTYCPECDSLLIKRYGFDVVKYNVTSDKKCPKCKASIPIIGNYITTRPNLVL